MSISQISFPNFASYTWEISVLIKVSDHLDFSFYTGWWESRYGNPVFIGLSVEKGLSLLECMFWAFC